jgi:hypothetical protein
MKELLLNNELEKLKIQAVLAKCEILFWNLPGGTEENHKIRQSG